MVAGNDAEGNVVASVLAPKAIDSEGFKNFITTVRNHKPNGERIYLVIDNLPMHHMKTIRAHAEERNVELVFNAPYSSPYNPIEVLWGYSKRLFTKACVEYANYAKRLHAAS